AQTCSIHRAKIPHAGKPQTGGLMSQKPLVIALEEHFMDAEIGERMVAMGAPEAGGPPGSAERLADLGELRIKEMDEAGIDIQVLSQTASSVQNFDAESAVAI